MQMDLINQLQQTKTETLIFFELGDEDLHKTYAPGKWTIQYILHHLTDAEAVLFDRIRRIISEPRPWRPSRAISRRQGRGLPSH